METLFIVGRILFGGFFIWQAYNHFRHQSMLAVYARAKGVPLPTTAVLAGGVFLLIGGLSILLGYAMVIGMGLLVLFLVPTTIMMHAFWKETDPQIRAQEEVQFSKNIALIGALCIMIAMVFIFF